MRKSYKLLLAILCIAVIVASAIIAWPQIRAIKNFQYHKPVELRELKEIEKWRLFLMDELKDYGYAYKDYRILREVIQCESSWRQYWKGGEVVESNGNIGLGQVNRLAHKETYTEMGLDPGDPYDNLAFSVFLYDRDGLRPWRQWSGWCWEPKINF